MRRKDDSPIARTTPKKRYRTPTVRNLGNINELTQGLASGPNFDGGGGANIYAS